jgi:hypothetical protein
MVFPPRVAISEGLDGRIVRARSSLEPLTSVCSSSIQKHVFSKLFAVCLEIRFDPRYTEDSMMISFL